MNAFASVCALCQLSRNHGLVLHDNTPVNEDHPQWLDFLCNWMGDKLSAAIQFTNNRTHNKRHKCVDRRTLLNSVRKVWAQPWELFVRKVPESINIQSDHVVPCDVIKEVYSGHCAVCRNDKVMWKFLRSCQSNSQEQPAKVSSSQKIKT